MTATNPFFDISLLPYQAPHFDQINDSHYRPAFDEALRQKRADIDAIVAQAAAPDFTNTVLALEKSGAMLSQLKSKLMDAGLDPVQIRYIQEIEANATLLLQAGADVNAVTSNGRTVTSMGRKTMANEAVGIISLWMLKGCKPGKAGC